MYDKRAPRVPRRKITGQMQRPSSVTEDRANKGEFPSQDDGSQPASADKSRDQAKPGPSGGQKETDAAAPTPAD